MSEALHISIPKPCHESWQQMTPNEQGRHCMACQKTVVDFSLMSDQEILYYISTAHNQVCGRFDNHQLDRMYAEGKKKSAFSWRYVWNMLVATFLVGGSAKEAQARKGEVVVENKIGKLFPAIMPLPQSDTTITGTIVSGSVDLPVSYASVMIKGTSQGAVCDSMGRFILNKLPSGNLTLVISSIGYKSYELEVNTAVESKGLTIRLEQAEFESITLGMVVTAVKVRKLSKIKRQVQEWLPKKDVKVFPNPVIPGNSVNVNLNLKEVGDYKAELMDLNGKIVRIQALQNVQKGQTINIPTEAGWSRGAYWLRITNNTKKVYTAKVLLQ